MPLVERPSTFPEIPDPLDLLDAAAGELLEDAGLPPVAGGQFPAFLEDAWSWTWGNLMEPGGDYIQSILTAVGRVVVGAITTVASWILKWVYSVFRTGILWAVPVGERGRFPAVSDEVTQGPYLYLKRMFDLIVTATWGRVSGGLEWLWGLVSQWVVWIFDQIGVIGTWLWEVVSPWLVWIFDQIGVIGTWLWELVGPWLVWIWDQIGIAANWLWELVSPGITWVVQEAWRFTQWLYEQVSAGVTWVVGEAWRFTQWLYEQVSAGVTWVAGEAWRFTQWLYEQVSAGVTWLAEEVWKFIKWLYDNAISKIPEGIIAGAAEIGKLIREAFEWLVNNAFGPFVGVVQAKLAIPGKLIRAEYTSLEELLDDMLDPPAEMLKGWTGMILLPFIVVGLLVNMVTGLSGPLLEPVLQEQARSVGARIPPFQTLRAGLLRGELSEGVHDDWLGRSGFDGANIELQKTLYDEIPGPTDLVRMGVREVFTPEIAEQFGQFEDFPPAFAEWMAKQGFTEEWARNFWGAHWDLPSTMQGFEMFHRDVIAEPDLQLLLRALDVMPFWRDKLTEIAYRVVTRVDVRRMYQEGVFNREQVLRVYKDLGYKPEDAEDLTEFVVRRYPPKGSEEPDDLRSVTVSATKQAYARRLITQDDALENLQELNYSPDDALLILSIWEFDWTQDPSLRSDVRPKEVARSVIEKAYERRLIDLNAGVQELGELGYTAEDASLLLQLVDLRLEEQVADLEVDVILNDYDAGLITEGDMAARLRALHIPPARVDFLVRLEVVRRQSKMRRLTLSQLEEAFRKEQITEADFRVRLDRMGYNPSDVGILVVQAGGSLTIGQLQAAYRRGALTEAELRARLAEQGVVGHDIDLLIPVAVRRPTVAQLQEAFRRGEMAEGTFRERLVELAVEPRDVDLLVAITPRLPSISELRKAFDAGIITEAQLRARFAELGYDPGDVDLLMALTLEAA